MDELDYMGDNDYSTIAAIANERADIGITASSTPTGKRGVFYSMCCDPSFGYKEFYFSSSANPNWTDEMDERARAQYNDQQYTHEVLAEFGTEEAGVFNKDKLDLALTHDYYTYIPLTEHQKKKCADEGAFPTFYDYFPNRIAPPNPFRTAGVDWDVVGASSSIIVLDFDVNVHKFRVIKRIEVPRAEYSLDNAVNYIIKVNEIYQPAWIYADRGYGE